MSIFAYADKPGNPGWRTAPVAWDGSQVVVDVGCGSGFDLRQLLPGGRCRSAIGLDLSAGMLRGASDLLSTGRLTLLRADAQALPLRDDMADVGLAMHMLYHVPDIPAALRELRRVVRPGGTVLISTNSTETMSEINGLMADAIAEQLGRRPRTSTDQRFTTENAGALAEAAFGSVTLKSYDVPLSFEDPAPVVAYLDSVRDPILASLGGQLDFDAALGHVAAGVEAAVREHGRFRTAYRTGVLICQ